MTRTDSPNVYILPEQQLLQTGYGTNRDGSPVMSVTGPDIIALIKYLSIQCPPGQLERTGTVALLLLVPGGLSDPVQGETGIGTDLNRSCLSLPDGLLHRLHQVLSIVHQHLGSLL